MKTLILVMILTLSGCAHQTVHEFCIDNDNQSHYKDYDQCYAEVLQERKEKRKHGSAFAHIGDGLINASKDNSTNCTTTFNGGIANTYCN